MQRYALLPSLLTLACSTAPSGDDTGTAEQPTINATVVVLDAMNGSGMADVTAINDQGQSTTTNSSGSATLPVPADSDFQVRLQKEGDIDHVLFGPTGPEDFQYVTFFAQQSMITMVVNMLGATTVEGTGVVVVGIDYDDLRPAVGATASIDAVSGDPWVLGARGAAYGDTIPQGGMGMVAFPNVPPGDLSVTVTPPPNASECTAFPGGGEMPTVPVGMNEVTVVTFHCR